MIGPPEPIDICDWSPIWAETFRAKATALRACLGARAARIDHIGSTSIRGMAAKSIVDIQVSVTDFEPMPPLESAMKKAGYVWKRENPELTKRYFREQPGAERTHVHVRRVGSWHEQWALLFRDYMRGHTEEHATYIALKRELAERFRTDRTAYTEGKADFFWAAIRRADYWAADTGWRPGASDA